MYLEDDNPSDWRYPKIPLERRAYAFLLDFIAIWLTSSFFGGPSWFNFLLQALVFMVTWFALRVVLVEKNKGQSPGKWAYDMRVLDPRYNSTPTLADLAKREGILGICALLAMIGLNINFRNALSMLIFITPLVIDCAIALGDEDYNLAFHDRMAQTLVVPTRRGFSLDLRLKKLWYLAKDKFQKNQERRRRDRY
ncbi:MAG: RDD family protein [Microcystaceae cyanobacterium]